MKTFINDNITFEDIKSTGDLCYLTSYSCLSSAQYQNERWKAEDLFNELNDVKKVDEFCRKIYFADLAKKYKKQANLSKRFAKRTFDNFNIENKMQQNAYDKAVSYAKNIENYIENGTNIIFIGGDCVGTGKTHLACSIANKILDSGIPVKVLNVMQLVDGLKEFTPAFKRELTSVEVLLIDDIGKENGTVWLCSEIYGILNARYEAELPTILTTEGTIGNIETNYIVEINGNLVNKGRSMVSRLMESCFVIQMQGDDYRLKGGKGE